MPTRRMLFGAALAVAIVTAAGPLRAETRTRIAFWHGLPQPLGGLLEQIAADFSAAQPQYQVDASFKGSYPETMTAAIAAFRAGRAPHIVQMFEVGTATTMLAAGPAVKPVHELMAETGTPFDPAAYLPAVRGYYSTADGRMMAMPFNSSTAVMFYNKDAFRAAGLDPEAPPQTWPDLIAVARALRASGHACPFTTAWPTWTQFEQFSALHDVPFATLANGFEGLGAALAIDSPLHLRQVQLLIDLQAEGLFKYGGRDAAADALFPSGQCAIIHASSGLRGRIVREAAFAWGEAMLPYWPDVPGAPLNSIIGGASFWVMTAPDRTAEEYRGVAAFFSYISRPEVMAKWHTDTGYLPITFAAYERTEASGFYRDNPGTDIPIRQITRTAPTGNSRGLRLGNLPEIRNIIQEELEKAFQGQQTAEQALANAVQRGNVVLRAFERANRN